MIAASSLVVAVLASYAGLAALSLTASTSLPFNSLQGIEQVVTGVVWHQQSVDKMAKLGNPTSGSTPGALADTSLISFGEATDPSTPKAFNITNQSSAPLAFTVQVMGDGARGVSASFSNRTPTMSVRPKRSATVYVTSSATYAGPITGSLKISAPGLTPKYVKISGTQAPLPPGAVTATPVAGGAVDLSWAPSGSVSGVAGYIVSRSTDGTTWTPVTGVVNATTAVDQTPSDAQYSYEVVAVAEGSGALQSTPGPTATATSDSAAPAAPATVSGPTWINAADQGDVPITVTLQGTTQPSDTITVTLTGPAGATATEAEPGGTTTVNFHVNAQALADGKVTASATASDSLGNTSGPTLDQFPITKDTQAPGDPTVADPAPMITQQNEKTYLLQYETSNPTSDTDTVHAVFQDANGATVPASGSVGDGPLAMPDLSKLADGQIQISVWITDAAGNSSDKVTTQATMTTAGPAAPTELEIAPGPNNPAGVVTPQSAHDVYITATFAQAPTADDEIKVFASHHTLVDQPGDGETTAYTFGPFDFSDLDAGKHLLAMMQIDGLGNKTWTPVHFTVDGGVTGPTSVGVPAGPNNPAGYVNSATQTAATIVATFAAATDPADQIALSVDGLSLGTQPGGGDQLSWTGDLSSLPDGTLQIIGTITDPNGVQTSFSGTLIKDTQPPPAPAVAGVVGPPPNVITPGNASCVKVAVAFNQAPDPSDVVTATLSDGTTSVQGSAPAGDGQVTVNCIDASSLSAGPVSVTITVTDVAGNSVTFTGTPAAKVACHNQNQG